MKQEGWAAKAASMSRRGMAVLLVYTMIPLGLGDVYAFGQEAPPPPDQMYDQGPAPQAYQPLSPEQLDQLVAPIALYPDALVAQVLAGATYPSQVVDADRWVQSYGGASPEQLAEMANGMPWDPSVKSLTAFPGVLNNMEQNLDWTTQLGNAYYNQPQDVMNAVQYMRQVAYQDGRLRSTPQLYVTYEPSYVTIVPANPDVVYVPYYDPWTVYGRVIVGHPWYHYYYAPPRGVVFGAFAIGFGAGIAVAAFGHWGWGCNHWHPDWHNRTIIYNRTTYVSRSVTVVNHGYYGRFDRDARAPEFNRTVAMHAAVYRAPEPVHGNFAGRNAMQNNMRQPYNQNWARERGNNLPRYEAPHAVGQPARNWNRVETDPNMNRPAQNWNHAQPQNWNHAQPQNWNHAQPQNFSRPAQSFNRPAQNYNRPAQNFGRPQVQGARPPAQNWNRPQPGNRPAPQHRAPQEHAVHHDEHGGGHGHWR
ncbi:DUF3300 domain-containing protein [Acidobacterium capsulatum]|uniref:Conserved domain protein n=3 Tax=Acidobacterium TaxID=33973 RepID=C1F2P3_ACIC5|nr:DUF3300 domain-containing protein [Acidobacterium capsulatum]ACO32128.1 conserved domain protein [Acidobacterium capsulatum ATCC 51196]